MRPYLAVLKDSFREALASRVLWIVIILTTLALVVVAPLGIKEETAARLRRNSVRNWPALVAKIDDERQSGDPSPGRQIWNRWSDQLKGQLAEAEKFSPGELSVEMVEQLVNELNAVLDDPTFYDAPSWQAREPGGEAEKLLERGVPALGADEVARLNRLLLKAAYPKEIVREQGSEFYLKYPFFDPLGPLPFDRTQLTALVQSILTSIINYIIGGVAVLAAILVTASIIPQTFEAGAIDLLLSKPVSRTVVFLTKFLGGCAFIGLIAAYFITGLWFIAGLRYGVWSHKLFLCIPILLFLFAVYYSVSALAGVLWRNAIVSAMVSILFWGLCFGVRVAKTGVETWLAPQRVVKLIPAGKTLLAVNEAGQVAEWREKNSAWDEVFIDENRPPGPGGFLLTPPMIGPVYDARRDRLVAVQSPPPGNTMGGLFGPAPTLAVGNRANGWVRKKGAASPAGAVALFDSPRGDVVVLTRGAIYRLAAEPNGADSKPKGGKFVRSGPEPALHLEPGASAAQDADSGAIALFNHGVVTVLEPDDAGMFERKAEKEIVAAKDASAAVVALAGNSMILALGDGRVLILDVATLELRNEFRPAGETAPRFAAAAPGGGWFLVLFHNRTLWLYDIRQARHANFWLTGQGNISAAVFSGSG